MVHKWCLINTDKHTVVDETSGDVNDFWASQRDDDQYSLFFLGGAKKSTGVHYYFLVVTGRVVWSTDLIMQRSKPRKKLYPSIELWSQVDKKKLYMEPWNVH